jgi:hypothetical protein
MRRHYHPYFKGLSHFKPYREKLVTTNRYEEIMAILEEVRERYVGEEVIAEL